MYSEAGEEQKRKSSYPWLKVAGVDVELHQVNNNLDTESCTETPMSTSAFPMLSDAALNSFSYHPGTVARSRRRRSELGFIESDEED